MYIDIIFVNKPYIIVVFIKTIAAVTQICGQWLTKMILKFLNHLNDIMVGGFHGEI